MLCDRNNGYVINSRFICFYLQTLKFNRVSFFKALMASIVISNSNNAKRHLINHSDRIKGNKKGIFVAEKNILGHCSLCIKLC